MADDTTLTFTALDLGLDAPCAGFFQISLEAFGVVQRSRLISSDESQSDEDDGVLAFNEAFCLDVPEHSDLRCEMLLALLSSDDEESDVHFVVHHGATAEGATAELASGFINLGSLLGTSELESDHTLELFDAQNAVVGALSRHSQELLEWRTLARQTAPRPGI